jgi:hypothetical protein
LRGAAAGEVSLLSNALKSSLLGFVWSGATGASSGFFIGFGVGAGLARIGSDGA